MTWLLAVDCFCCHVGKGLGLTLSFAVLVSPTLAGNASTAGAGNASTAGNASLMGKGNGKRSLKLSTEMVWVLAKWLVYLVSNRGYQTSPFGHSSGSCVYINSMFGFGNAKASRLNPKRLPLFCRINGLLGFGSVWPSLKHLPFNQGAR